MKALAILSIAINVVLAGYVVNFRQLTQPVQRQEKSTSESSTMKSNFIARRPAGPKTETFAVSNLPLSAFHWRQVESDDYRAYIANLRAIGCPEETIRDIIIADVEKLYAKRLAPLRKPEEEFKFWTTGNSISGSEQAPEFYKAQRGLAKEKKELLKQLLGAHYEKELAKQYGGGPQPKDSLEHLPRETRDKASELYQKFSEQQSDLYQQAKGSIDSTTQNGLRVLKRQLHDDLAKVLSPEDLFEFEVRTSDVARNLKYELQAFDATEQEFRAIFKAKQNVEFLDAGADDGLEAALGEARYKEYKRAEDSDYQNLFRFADSRGLERTTVDQIYQLKDEAQEAAKEVRRNKDLSEDQRMAALAAIRAETEKTVMEALGEKNFKTYKRSAYWLRNLNPQPASAVR
jgi:hypothetical protein